MPQQGDFEKRGLGTPDAPRATPRKPAMQRHAGCRSRSRPFLASVVGLSIRTTPDPTSGQSIPSITRPLDSPFPRSPDPWAVHFLYHKTSGQSIPSITRPGLSTFFITRPLDSPPSLSQDPWTVHSLDHKNPGQSISSILDKTPGPSILDRTYGPYAKATI